jgi:hypothetical protein
LHCQAGSAISINFVLREVRTAAYKEQQADLCLIIVIVKQGIWLMGFNDNIEKKSSDITI